MVLKTNLQSVKTFVPNSFAGFRLPFESVLHLDDFRTITDVTIDWWLQNRTKYFELRTSLGWSDEY